MVWIMDYYSLIKETKRPCVDSSYIYLIFNILMFKQLVFTCGSKLGVHTHHTHTHTHLPHFPGFLSLCLSHRGVCVRFSLVIASYRRLAVQTQLLHWDLPAKSTQTQTNRPNTVMQTDKWTETNTKGLLDVGQRKHRVLYTSPGNTRKKV